MLYRYKVAILTTQDYIVGVCDLGYTGDPCTKCAAGKFKDVIGPAACSRCSAGSEKTTNFEGAMRKKDCEYYSDRTWNTLCLELV